MAPKGISLESITFIAWHPVFALGDGSSRTFLGLTQKPSSSGGKPPFWLASDTVGESELFTDHIFFLGSGEQAQCRVLGGFKSDIWLAGPAKAQPREKHIAC